MIRVTVIVFLVQEITNRAVVIKNTGGPDVLQVAQIPVTAPADNQVQVHIHYAGVNHVDGYIREGAFGTPTPFTPGLDGAGIVNEVGKNIKTFKKGDRVFIFTNLQSQGTYAQYGSFPETRLFPLPANVTFAQGAAAGLAYFTAYRALFQIPNKLKKAKTALINGASGGVGIAAVQLAKQAGLTVYGTAGSDDGLKVAKQAGADYVFDYKNEAQKLAAAINKIGGVDIILDGLANEGLPKDLDFISKKGTIVVLNEHGPVNADLSPLINAEAYIGGVLWTEMNDSDVAEAGAVIVKGLQNGSLAPIIGQEFPLEKAGDAQKELQDHYNGKHAKGKIVIVTQPQTS